MPAASVRQTKTAQLILTAIADLDEENGSSVEKICDHILNEYEVPAKEFKRYLNKTIERGVAFGAIKKYRGRLRIGDVLERLSKYQSGRAGGGGKKRRSGGGGRGQRRK